MTWSFEFDPQVPSHGSRLTRAAGCTSCCVHHVTVSGTCWLIVITVISSSQMEDNKRSIPCLLDGLKPSQRKVLFSCFKRNLKKEIKVQPPREET